MKRKRKFKRRKRRKLKYGSIAFSVVLLCFFMYFSLHQPDQTNRSNINQGFPYKAAIVDHLSLTAPNQTFIQTATNTLKQAGYRVDYYSGEKVNVEFYRNLPTHGYGLIILRVHSTATEAQVMFSPMHAQRAKKT